MVASIDNALITEFSSMVHTVAQQTMSRLKPYVQVKQMSGDVWAYDGLGRVEAREIEGRNVPATFDDISHSRRKLSRRRFVINLPVDASDVRGALLNPESEYAKAVANGMIRQIDRVIYQAAFADVLTGRDFATNLTAAADGVLTVDATAGLTYEKLLEINQNFADNDVGIDESERTFLTITGKQTTALMGEIEFINNQYNTAAPNGGVNKNVIETGLGLDLVRLAGNVSSPIIPTVGGQRALLAASSRGIVLGISKEMGVKIENRPDYFETTQVQVIMEMGAVRTEGALVQRVNVTA